MVRFSVRYGWPAVALLTVAGVAASCSGQAPRGPSVVEEDTPVVVPRNRVSLELGTRTLVANLEVAVLSAAEHTPALTGERYAEISRWIDASVQVKNSTGAALWPPDFTVRCPTGESTNYLDYGDATGFGLRLIPPNSTHATLVRLAIPDGCDAPMLEVTATDPTMRLAGRAPMWALE